MSEYGEQDEQEYQGSDGSFWGDMVDAAHHLKHAAGEAVEGVYHGALAGAEAMIGAPSASEDWALAGEHLHQAGEHLGVVHDDVMDSWYKSGITHADPIE